MLMIRDSDNKPSLADKKSEYIQKLLCYNVYNLHWRFHSGAQPPETILFQVRIDSHSHSHASVMWAYAINENDAFFGQHVSEL